ncbi:late competence development ComFB family protein [Reinekea sp. G2M2-21]|uniref:late competence development ComFB family protein n=1 Tax=Reinekea sp. G2M2-21 TaxID=2788942 RepID=UPI0018AAFABC|nr:late competence development ComFB family protein [Reinekea sp. G2M2-21]
MSFDSQISNFYEKLVVDELGHRSELADVGDDMLIDMACVALNQLPARYYRYSVDMAFYLPASEMQKMEDDVTKAVEYAISFVQSRSSRS